MNHGAHGDDRERMGGRALSPPWYSIVIPAYNEQEFLPATLAAARSAMAAVALSGELIVVDNNSTDRTAAVATAAEARVVFAPVNRISSARNAGGRAARGRHLLFLDADTLLTPVHLRRALAALALGRACGGGSVIAFDVPLPAGPRLTLAFWNRLSCRLGWAAGCFLFCTRAAFEAVGGFDERVYISEEIGFSRRLAAWGRPRGLRMRILDGPAIISSARKIQHLSPRYTALTLLAILAGPLGTRSRRLCAFWYERPWQTVRTGKPSVGGVDTLSS